jgi:uncharacterized protein YndB with AHSA1/START domain
MNPVAPVDTTDTADESLVYELELAAPVEKVWHALTDPALVAQWLLPQPEEHASEIELHLATSRPPHYVAYHWQGEGEPPSLVSFELRTAPDGGTRLRLTHQRIAVGIAVAASPHTLLMAA